MADSRSGWGGPEIYKINPGHLVPEAKKLAIIKMKLCQKDTGASLIRLPVKPRECTSRSHILNHYSRPPLTQEKSNEEGKGNEMKTTDLNRE